MGLLESSSALFGLEVPFALSRRADPMVASRKGVADSYPGFGEPFEEADEHLSSPRTHVRRPCTMLEKNPDDGVNVSVQLSCTQDQQLDSSAARQKTHVTLERYCEAIICDNAAQYNSEPSQKIDDPLDRLPQRPGVSREALSEDRRTDHAPDVLLSDSTMLCEILREGFDAVPEPHDEPMVVG